MVLISAFSAHGQQAEWAKLYSEKFHFIADFPEQPKESGGEIDTRFGKAPSKRWSVEAPGILYEVSVSEFSDIAIKDAKSLNLFYEAVCTDLFGDCKRSGHGDDQFDVVGRQWGFRSGKQRVAALMYLARNRFYLAKVVVSNRLEKDEEAWKTVRKFLDGFLFIHVKEGENKWTWGLPPSAAQILQAQ